MHVNMMNGMVNTKYRGHRERERGRVVDGVLIYCDGGVVKRQV